MAAELFDNSFITSLSADINNVQPTIPVTAIASAALRVTPGQFRILIDAERMLVTANANTNTWTVTRGIENTTPSAHLSGASVAHILTVGGFLNHHTIHEPGGADPFTLLDDTNFNTLAKDGLASRPSLRTLGTGSQQAAAGTDTRFTDSRSPLTHATTHRYNGSDPLYTMIPTPQSADYGAAVGDLVLMSGTHTVTMPIAPANGAQVSALALSGSVTIARGGAGDTITSSGSTGQISIIIQTGQSISLVYRAGVWYGLIAATAGGGGGGVALAPVSASVDTIASPNQLVLMTGAHNITLPTAPANGTQVGVYALTAPCAFQRGGADTIEWSGATPSNSLAVPTGSEYVLEYSSGVWYGAGQIAGGVIQPSRAYRNAALSSAAGTNTAKIPMDTKSYDPVGSFDVVTNGRYVCSAAGYYSVQAEIDVLSTAAGQQAVAFLYKNGVQISEGSNCVSSATGQGLASTVADVIQCNAGDSIELWMLTTAALALSTSTGTNFLTVTPLVGTGAPSGQGITTQARAYRNAAMNTVASTWTKVSFDTATGAGYDPGNNFQTASGRYVCPVTGYYLVDTQLSANTTALGQSLSSAIYKNGAEVTSGNTAVNTIAVQTILSEASDVVFCQAGDILETYTFANAVLAVNTGSIFSYLSVVQVGGVNAVNALSPTVQVADYAVGPGQLVIMNGAHNVTLPSAPMSGSQVAVYATNGNTTLNRAGTDTINFNNTPGLTTTTVPAGSVVILSYLNGVWYGANPFATNLTQPARAYRAAALSLVAATWTKIPVDTKSFDAGGNFDVATNRRYNVPQSGYYQVEAQVALSSTATGQQATIAIYKNGVLLTNGDSTYSSATGQSISSTVSEIVQCNAGDYLEIWAFSTAALAVSVGSNSNYLSVAQFGGLGAPAPGQGIATQARATRASNGVLALTANTTTKVVLDSKTYDPGNNFDATGRYVCPVTGYYQTTAAVWIAVGVTSGVTQASIFKNGSNVASIQATTPASSVFDEVVSDIIFCQAGDYLELWVSAVPAGCSLQWNSNVNYLSVVQVGGANIVGALSPTAQIAPYNAGVGQLVLMTGSNAVTLPSAPQAGSQVGVNALTNTLSINRAGTDTINYNGASGQTTVSVPQGSTAILTYLNGTWYGAGPTQTTLAPPARASRVAAFSTVAAAQKIPLDTVNYDPGGIAQIANSRFVCPFAGYYEVNGVVTSSATAGQIQAMVYKNGAEVGTGNIIGASANGMGSVVSDVVQCNAGDVLELWVWASGVIVLSPGTQNIFLAVSQVGMTGAPQLPAGQGISTQARAYRNASFTTSAATFVKIPIDTASFDPGSNLQLANSRYVCPVTGYYQVNGEVAVTPGASDTLLVAIYKNGARITTGSGEAGVQTVASVADVVQCNAGDYLELWAVSTDADALQVSSFTNFLSVYQIAGSNIVGSLSPTSQVADVTVGPGQSSLMLSGRVVTLPNAPQNGTEEEIVATNGTTTVQCQGTDTINYYNTAGLTRIKVAQGQTLKLRHLNGVWFVADNPVGATDHLQPGVVNAGDLAISAVSIAAGTGIITFTPASGVMWVQGSGGVLIRVVVVGGSPVSVTPTGLPASGQWATARILVDAAGNFSAACGATAAGTNSGSAILSTAADANKQRIADVGIANVAGNFVFSNNGAASQGVNWFDRRPWARGAFSLSQRTTADVTTSSTAWIAVDTATLQVRMECSGAPVKVKALAEATNTSVSNGAGIGVNLDGVFTAISQAVASAAGWGVNLDGEVTLLPSAGSHLFTLMCEVYTAGTATILGRAGQPLQMQIEEVIRANTNNGVI